jgi:hypothetical protein
MEVSVEYISPPTRYPRFEQDFPGWFTLVKKVTEPCLTFNDVDTYVGVTKQQIDYWISKGILSYREKEPQKWRRYSLIDLFLLAVAFGFRKHGLDISGLRQVRDGVLLSGPHSLDIVLVQIIYGEKVFLVFDSEGCTIAPVVDPKKTTGDPSYEDIQLDFPLRKKTAFFVGLSLKKTCDELVRKLALPDFKVNIEPDGSYKFWVNGVPLVLESLIEEDVIRRLPDSTLIPIEDDSADRRK